MDVSVSSGKSSLFHDVETFNYLKHEILPALLAQAPAQPRDLRLWSVGCGTGEDPYALAMLLTDLLAACRREASAAGPSWYTREHEENM